MRVSDFNYSLPNELIAQYPTPERRGSRLLDVGEVVADRTFAELPALLRQGDLLVFNDTRVIPARLRGRKESGGRIEILIERVESDLTALAHIRASKSPKPGSKLLVDDVEITVNGRDGELFSLAFSSPVMALLECRGPCVVRRVECVQVGPQRRPAVYHGSDGLVRLDLARRRCDSLVAIVTHGLDELWHGAVYGQTARRRW